MSEHQQLKSQAMAYYQKNKVPLLMQDALNVMFHADPQDANGYISTYFENISMPPTVTRIVAAKSMDNKGQPAITAKIYCVLRNKESMMGESRVSVDTCLMENSKTEDKEAEDVAREQEINTAISLINQEFQETVASCDIHRQQDVDQTIYELVEEKRRSAETEKLRDPEGSSPLPTADDGKKANKKSGKSSGKKKGAQIVVVPDKVTETAYPGCTAVTALSQAFSIASASTSHVQLFEHLIKCYGGDDQSITMPLPATTLLMSGKAALGKNNCIKEYMIVPRSDMAMRESILATIKIQEFISKSLYAKGGVAAKSFNDFGAPVPMLDKPEQGLDMINDSVTHSGYEMGKDFFFLLNAASHECFDYDKGKYEVVTGVAKSPDDMADFWADICNRYPSIIGIIDPVRSEEREQWNKVCSSISERCLVIADRGYDRPGKLITQELNFHEFATSGLVLRLEGCNTITHIVECSKKMSDMNNTVILAGGQHETNDTTLVDIAVACRARFIKLGALNRGERVAKFNRLMDIEDELAERKTIWPTLEFPAIPPALPTPTPGPEEMNPTEE